MMLQLRLGVRWVRAGENGPCSDDGKHQNTVVNLTPLATVNSRTRYDVAYIVERMDRNAVTFANSPCLQTCNQLANERPGLVA